MIHIFKKGGNRTTDKGQEYSIEAINEELADEKKAEGWSLTLEEALATESADTNGDGAITLEEAKAYAAANDIDIEGIHHKTVIKMVKDHMSIKA